MASASDAQQEGSVTETVEKQEESNHEVLHLRLHKPKPDKKVKWTNSTVDNEHMNKKKSKCCCIYEKPKLFGESSSEDEDDDCTHNCQGHKKKCYQSHDDHDHGEGASGGGNDGMVAS
ncbi:hypothetical protein LOTGIDRAFT_231207 [Lottia gigantea]|uniref:E3 ubiquitin-protein ligase PPP1R11 n=1 Tax=Lottia gigantea TaxID=225164 RepID=V4ANV2_LOTGI|nr:hypothetical protein LOTGIDRAFT_231207 [Lottia gigantea]ESO98842.1 hypothetical protein LOTGIDRAFT_231207 [Lottia gigantea]